MEGPQGAAGRGELTARAIDRLMRVMRAHRRVIEKRVEGLGIHHGQHWMLMRLYNMGRTASQKDIAEALDVSPACVARMLKGLSAAALIEKCEGTDGRRREISVTPEGEKLVVASHGVFKQIGGEMFEGVSDEDMRTLCRILESVQENLGHMESRKE